MKRITIIILAFILWIVSIGAVKKNPINSKIDFEGQGFVKMKTTAYCVGHHTADGSAVFEGGCASSLDRIGMVAIVYSTGGDFLGYYIVNDTGAEGGGVRRGEVLDIYRSDLERCQDWMDTVGESQSVWVRFVDGKG